MFSELERYGYFVLGLEENLVVSTAQQETISRACYAQSAVLRAELPSADLRTSDVEVRANQAVHVVQAEEQRAYAAVAAARSPLTNEHGLLRRFNMRQSSDTLLLCSSYNKM